jgi:hypothetical protein
VQHQNDPFLRVTRVSKFIKSKKRKRKTERKERKRKRKRKGKKKRKEKEKKRKEKNCSSTERELCSIKIIYFLLLGKKYIASVIMKRAMQSINKHPLCNSSANVSISLIPLIKISTSPFSVWECVSFFFFFFVFFLFSFYGTNGYRFNSSASVRISFMPLMKISISPLSVAGYCESIRSRRRKYGTGLILCCTFFSEAIFYRKKLI